MIAPKLEVIAGELEGKLRVVSLDCGASKEAGESLAV